MNQESNGKHCQLCKVNIARDESYGCGVYLCEGCATKQAVVRDEVKRCTITGCDRDAYDWKSWDQGNFCKECFRRIEEGFDARRDTVRLNRSSGLNDDGTMTRVVKGVTNGNIDADGDITYERRSI